MNDQQPSLTKQITDLLADAGRGTNLALRTAYDSTTPSSASEITYAELAEYTFTMIDALQTAAAVLAAHIDALTAQLGELDR